MSGNNNGFSNIFKYLLSGMPKTSFAAIVIVFACAVFKESFSVGQHLFVCIGMLIICGYETAIGAVRAVLRKRYLHQDVYLTVAILGTFVIGMFYESIIAAAVFAICRSVINTFVEWTEHHFGIRTDEDVLIEKRKSSFEKSLNGAVNAFSSISLFVIIALTVIVPLIWRVELISWLRRAFILFAAACPGAITISASIEYYKCLNASYEKQIRFTSRESFEKCSKVTSVVFGNIELVSSYRYDIDTIEPVGISKAELLLLAAYGCSFSRNEVYETIVRESGIDVDLTKVDMYKNIDDKGTAVMLGDVKLIAGNDELISEFVKDRDDITPDDLTVYIAANGKYAGKIRVKNADDSDYSLAIKKLNEADLDRVMLLTSSPEAEARVISEKIGISETWYGLSFDERQTKLKNLRDMQIDNEGIAFVADSAEDAKLIDNADVGITIGASASIIEADAHISDNDHAKIADIFIMAHTLMRNVKRNVKVAIIFKILTILLAIFGIAGVWSVAIIDTIAMVLVLRGKKGSEY